MSTLMEADLGHNHAEAAGGLNVTDGMTPATHQKRQQLLSFIRQVLEPQPEVQAVLAVGSIATGLARPDSDLDAILFLDPYDPYVVPAEFLWNPVDGTFHSHLTGEDTLQREGLQFDFVRCDLRKWADPAFSCPEGRRAELAEGWVAFDPSGDVTRVLKRLTRYPDDLRLARLDEAIVWLDLHLSDGEPEARWQDLGPPVAHDRLHAAYDTLAQTLFACNRRWRPWRNREMPYLLALPWLPQGFGERVLTALNAPGHDETAYYERVRALRALFAEIVARLVAEGLYGEDPIGEAFVRRHDEPGRAWNMDAWNREHGARRAVRAFFTSDRSTPS
jgi:hypothetical protein